jgi:hypothetical protein
VTDVNLLSDRCDINVEYKCWDPPLPGILCSIAPPDLNAGGAILATNQRWKSDQTQTPTAAVSPQPADLRSDSAVNPLLYRILPPAVMVFGLGLTVAWICLLVYGVFSITMLAI